MGLSEEAKVEYLRQKIKDVKSTGRTYNVVFIVGLVVFALGIFIESFNLIVIGIALGIISTVVGIYYNHKKNELMEQLRKMAYKEKENS